jgi:cysteinyl-tRNA synthetase
VADAHASTAPAEAQELRARFLEAMDDDFNTGGALGALFDLARLLNRLADQGRLEAADADNAGREAFVAGARVLKELSQILGLFAKAEADSATAGDRLTAPLIELLIDLRGRLRKAKNFAMADEIRDRLGALGIILEDRPDGTGWKISST